MTHIFNTKHLAPLLCTGIVAAFPAALAAGPSPEASALSIQTGDRPAPGETGAEAGNAADTYRQIYASFSPELIAALAETSRDSTTLDEGVRDEARKASPLLIEATRIEHCDWGVDYDRGTEVMLPHLTLLRDSMRLLRSRAIIAIDEGDADTAADATAAIIRLSRHVHGKLMIEGMIANGILTAGLQLASDHAEQWTDAHRRMLLAELKPFDNDEPFDFEAMLSYERELAAAEDIEGPDASHYDRARERLTDRLASTIEALQ